MAVLIVVIVIVVLLALGLWARVQRPCQEAQPDPGGVV